MDRKKGKFKSILGTEKPQNSLLRLLKSIAGFQASHMGQIESGQQDICNCSPTEIKSATLEATHQKARVIMEWQRHQRFC